MTKGLNNRVLFYKFMLRKGTSRSHHRIRKKILIISYQWLSSWELRCWVETKKVRKKNKKETREGERENVGKKRNDPDLHHFYILALKSKPHDAIKYPFINVLVIVTCPLLSSSLCWAWTDLMLIYACFHALIWIRASGKILDNTVFFGVQKKTKCFL